VNIITKVPTETRMLEARTFLGTSGRNPSGQLEVVGKGKHGRFDYLIGAVGEYGSRSGLTMPSESPGPNIPSYAGDRRTANDLNRRSLGLQASTGYRVPDTGHVVASAYFSGFSRGGDFAPWAQLTNGTDPAGYRTGTTISLAQGRFNLDGLLHTTKTFDLSLQSTYFQGGVLPADRIELGSDLWYARRRTSNRGVDSVIEARFIPNRRYDVIAGVESTYDHEELLPAERIIRATNQTVAAQGSDGRRLDLLNMGVFVSSNLSVVRQWLRLTGGIRYDHHSTYGSQLTGRFGATSRLSRSIVMKLLYGNAFKAPSPNLLFASPMGPGDVQGNSALLPQKIRTVEYQLSYRPSLLFAVTSDVSYSWLLDQAEFTPQGLNQVARNTASQTSFAWETRADLKHNHNSVYLSFELVRSKRNSGTIGYAADLVGTANSVYPPYIARFGATAAIPSLPSLPLSAGAEGMVVGPRHAAAASVLANGGQFDLKAYVTTNAFLTTRNLYLVRGSESVIALRAYNLLGTRGPDPGYSGFEYPLAPREIMLEMRVTY
jgi:iron complex outermembrane receptor protein